MEFTGTDTVTVVFYILLLNSALSVSLCCNKIFKDYKIFKDCEDEDDDEE